MTTCETCRDTTPRRLAYRITVSRWRYVSGVNRKRWDTIACRVVCGGCVRLEADRTSAVAAAELYRSHVDVAKLAPS